MFDSDAIKNEFIFFLKEKLHFNDSEIYIDSDKAISNTNKYLIKEFLKKKKRGGPIRLHFKFF